MDKVITCIISYADDKLILEQNHIAIHELHHHAIFVSDAHFCGCKHYKVIVKFLSPQPLLLLFNLISFNYFLGRNMETIAFEPFILQLNIRNHKICAVHKLRDNKECFTDFTAFWKHFAIKLEV